jgi:DHA2 family multidrug resistance protein
MKKIDARILVVVGTAIFGSSFLMNSAMTSLYGYDQFIPAQLLRALGQPLIMVPLSTLATSGIEKENAGSASSLFNMLRNLGGSVGIAVVGMLLTRREKLHSNRLGEHVSATQSAFEARLKATEAAFISRGVAAPDARLKAIAMTDNAIRREANVMAYNDAFLIMGFLLIGVGAMALFCRKVSPGAGGAGAH